jgi:hypothetical protein
MVSLVFIFQESNTDQKFSYEKEVKCEHVPTSRPI